MEKFRLSEFLRAFDPRLGILCEPGSNVVALLDTQDLQTLAQHLMPGELALFGSRAEALAAVRRAVQAWRRLAECDGGPPAAA